MSTVTIVLLVILVVLVGLLIGLYFFRKKDPEEARGAAGTDRSFQTDGFHVGHRQKTVAAEAVRSSTDGH